ncbi:uncharacterized protein LAESUDRAFT_763871 [Laetiporus sulphureus 93-53]|uniref:Uncharacterized protein n=1 Tax=Laetiporus sulphureus 93-53 TaxID=1314785 RepID=A0A165BLJ9_9APHY|nr:uncharacterized protein LAESUDRAFT_763871 [Laetiporus sulphureus 93-53]KZT01274.1 hypothetical protein LAESUDRAFT_763871 [Laetiporus sulphureus 93-53]
MKPTAREGKFREVKIQSQVRAAQALAKKKASGRANSPDVDVSASSTLSAVPSISDKIFKVAIETVTETASDSGTTMYPKILINNTTAGIDEYELLTYDDMMDVAPQEDSILQDLSTILSKHFTVLKEAVTTWFKA